jgi:hypothetical protein
MSYIKTGIVTAISATTSKVVKDKTYKEREITIDASTEYNGAPVKNFPKFTVKREALCNFLDSVKIGQQVNVHFDVKGFNYEKDGVGKNFTQVEAWKVEVVNTQGAQHDATQVQQQFSAPPTPDAVSDLPF